MRMHTFAPPGTSLPFRLERNDLGRDLVVGDIHGPFAMLSRALAALDVGEHDRVFSLGDLVDRGPDSFEAKDGIAGLNPSTRPRRPPQARAAGPPRRPCPRPRASRRQPPQLRPSPSPHLNRYERATMDERERLTEIDGSPVVHTFTILREGWEMDNTGWITANGAAYTTSHGGPTIPADPGE